MINPLNPDYSQAPTHPSRRIINSQLISWNDTPVLSIVTPFYNTGNEFHMTAQSILNQTLQQWEWLIINDGSSDSQAQQMLDDYRNRDPRIRIIEHAQNRGLSAARNTGFTNARCEFVLLIDSDDLLEATAAEKFWWFLETHPGYGFVASYHVAFGGLNYLWTGGFHDGAMNAERNRVSMMCMVRKSVHKAVGGFDESNRGGLEDWEFWMRCAALGYWGATIPEFLAWYRIRPDHSDRWGNLQETRLTEFRKSFQKKYPDLYRGRFPIITENIEYDLTTINLGLPDFNRLVKSSPHLLLILPRFVMGGAERFTLSLMDQLLNNGWTITVVATELSEHAWQYEFEKRTPFVYILPRFVPIKDYPRCLGYLIQSRGCDAILIEGSQEGYRLLPALRAFFPTIPLIDYLHFVTPDWMQGGFPKLSLLYRDFIDFSFTSCEQVRDWIVEAGVSAERVKTCYVGVDPEIWKPDAAKRVQVRSELGIDQSETVILYAARLEEQKQPDMLIETLLKLIGRGERFCALIAGEGSLMGQLKKQVREGDQQRQIQLLGGVPPDKMPAIMAASDIFFLPSKNEGISLALYEAMACGLVVVGAQVGGQAELVSPNCGILISSNTREDEPTIYANILQDIINDPSKRGLMSQESRKRIVEKFTLDRMGDSIHGELCRIIDNKKDSVEPRITDQEKQSILRETQATVEYLQARQEIRTLDQQLSTLVIPKKPSHWFYLWIRQLLLPPSTRVKTTFLGKIIIRLQQWLKHALIKPS